MTTSLSPRNPEPQVGPCALVEDVCTGDIRCSRVGDAARMATVIVRNDRFCEGSIAAAIAGGTFAAVLERPLRWFDGER